MVVEVDAEAAHFDDRARVSVRRERSRTGARGKRAEIERMGKDADGCGTDSLDALPRPIVRGEDEDGRANARDAHPAQHLAGTDVRKIAAEQDHVIVVELADLEPIFPQSGRIDLQATG